MKNVFHSHKATPNNMLVAHNTQKHDQQDQDILRKIENNLVKRESPLTRTKWDEFNKECKKRKVYPGMPEYIALKKQFGLL